MRSSSKRKGVGARIIKNAEAAADYSFEVHHVPKGGESLKLPDHAVADSQLYDDMERSFEKVGAPL